MLLSLFLYSLSKTIVYETGFKNDLTKIFNYVIIVEDKILKPVPK